ncbi:AraC family transcriptional regulator [Planotetraspora silvatica]|uniref:AraC family transcriptional regulator n=1 Tax=Planotetraspora silvatica TaxID=234614 RepID=A0A8J3XR63_9ACTN|nr:AraC family transcriptional regulator [Planotetraspora silvatica]GII49880.1 AraC family transcriptional regulator [Planotetraspora silvatica]
MAVDPLSDALRLIDARCVITSGFSAAGSWSLRFQPKVPLKLTALVRGSCWLHSDDGADPLLLEEGDVAVMNGRPAIVLCGDLAAEPADAAAIFAASPDPIVQIGDGRDVLSIGGHVEMNHIGRQLLLAALPPLTRVRADTDQAPALRWLLDRLLEERQNKRPGADFATHQHAQLLLVEILRAHVADAAPFPPGWLRVLADERIAPALRALHTDPARPWHLEDLARTAGISRTTFAEHFKAAAGVPPLTYLHHWRIRLAERALRDDDIPIAKLAATLGYGSDSAFSNAFKRATGTAPSTYRAIARTTRETIAGLAPSAPRR